MMETKVETVKLDDFKNDIGKENVFPYNVKSNPRSCYMVVFKDGQMAQFGRCVCGKYKNRELFDAVRNGEARLFVSWVGNWQTDLFQITNLDKFEEENSKLLSLI